VDDFYYLARTALVKDEAHYDKFDRAFAAYFKGVELLTDFTQDVPLEWLRKTLELELSPEQKAAIEKMGWDELMETLKKRFEEQKERHEGGSKMIGTGGTSPFGAYGYNPQGIRIGQAGGRNKSAVKVWDQRAYKDYDDTKELGTRNIKVALRRLRRFAREGAADELDLDDTIHCTAANAGMLDIKMVPERHNKVKVLLLMDVGGTMDEHIHRVEELFSAAKTEFKHLEFYYFHNCVYDFVWKNNRRRYSEKTATWDVIRKYNKDYKLIFVGDATMSPYEILQPGGSVEYNNEEGRRRVAAAPDARLPEVRLDQPRAAGRLAVPAEHFHRAATAQPAHVPAHAGRAGRRDALAEQMTVGVGALALLAALASGCASLPGADARRGAARRRHSRHAAAGTGPRRGAGRDPGPGRLKALLERFLDLVRLGRVVARDDVDDTEWSRLIDATPAQVRSLLQTEGYFQPRGPPGTPARPRAAGQPDLVRVIVEPGQRARVSAASPSRPKASSNAAPPRRRPCRGHAGPDPQGLALPSGQRVPQCRLGRGQGRRAGQAARGRLCHAAFSGTGGRSRRGQAGGAHLRGRGQRAAVPLRQAAHRRPGHPRRAHRGLLRRRARRGAPVTEACCWTSRTGCRSPACSTASASRWTPTPAGRRSRRGGAAAGIAAAGLHLRPGLQRQHARARFGGTPVPARVRLCGAVAPEDRTGRLRQAWDGEISSHPGEGLYRNLIGGAVERLLSDTDEVLSQRVRIGRAQDTTRLERLFFAELERSLRRTDAGDRNSATAGSLNFHGGWRDLDSIVLPSDGETLSIQLGIGRSRGTDADSGTFGRAYGRLTVYRPLGRTWYGQARVELGRVFLGSNMVVPESQKWRAGGDDSVRGYAYRTLGPLVDGAWAAARSLATGSLELARPIRRRCLRSGAPCSSTPATPPIRSASSSPKLGYGVGVRWRSPVGPLRLDLARAQKTGKARLHFSVGIAF
jgi:uncharacterized protein with von Willebrand factor type A (vWA) domain